MQNLREMGLLRGCLAVLLLTVSALALGQDATLVRAPSPTTIHAEAALSKLRPELRRLR